MPEAAPEAKPEATPAAAEPAAAAAAPAEEKKPEEPKAEEKKEEAKEEAFTAEQDEKLKELKGQNKTWKEIAEGMGLQPRDIGRLKARFKEIGPAPAPAAGNEKGGKGLNPGGGKKGKGGGKNKGDGGGEVAPKEEPAPAPAAVPTAGNVGGVSGEVKAIELQADDLFDVEDLQVLVKIVEEDQKNMWLRVASRFFDRTGQRVHPDDIKERFCLE